MVLNDQIMIYYFPNIATLIKRTVYSAALEKYFHFDYFELFRTET